MSGWPRTLPDFGCLDQRRLDWLLAAGVTVEALIHPTGIRLARGTRGEDGRFDTDDAGPEWLAIDVCDGLGDDLDIAFWRPTTGEMAVWLGRAFALGEHVIDDPWTYGIRGWLNVFPDPLLWLQHERRGIVVLDWKQAFDRLRDCPRIAVHPDILETYKKHMRPPQMPTLGVLNLAQEQADAA